MRVEVKYQEGKIYAYNVLKGNKPGAYHSEVTNQVQDAFLEYVVEMLTSTDGVETFETKEPVLKYGSMPYKVTIEVTPIHDKKATT